MKIFQALFVLALLCSASRLFAAGSPEEEAAKLTYMVNFQADEHVSQVIGGIVDEFNASQSGIEVEFLAGVPDYEALLKTKMATNDLPDLWSTHGWSVLRYSEYLMKLDDQEWVDRIHPAIEPVVRDENGHVYVLPFDVDMAGIAYNKTVVESADVDVSQIENWEDLYTAMEAVKASGVTPVHMGGRDSWTVGNFFDWAAPAVYVTDEFNYSGDELVSGTFDTGKWELVAGLLKELNDRGFINVDVLTSGYSDSARALAAGDAAFAFYGNYVLSEAWSFNPDADLGFFPVPAYYEGDESSLISGERTTAGIWKDTPHPEAALTFLSYLARPENVARIASTS